MIASCELVKNVPSGIKQYQIGWVRAGSALNKIREEIAA
jgi:hypothetical protein